MSVNIKLAVVLLTAMAVVLLYLSNANQSLLKQHLSYRWQRFAVLVLCTGLLFSVFHTVSLVFFWLVQLMLLTSLLPWLIFCFSRWRENRKITLRVEKRL